MYEKLSVYDDAGKYFAVSGSSISDQKTIGKGETPREAVIDWMNQKEKFSE